MNSLPTIEVFLRSDPLEAVVISDPPVEVNQPIFQTINVNQELENIDGLQEVLDRKEDKDPTILKEADIGVKVQEFDADYNTFTVAEKAKLAEIEDGAEANVNADWNATEGDAQILNKPDLGSAALTDASDYATAAQGELAESAIQPDVLALALQGKEDADPTILKAADIGDSVQPYDANTVVDSEYSTVKSKAETAVQPEEIANFETTAQLNARDAANRDRANHTGTQTIATITGLETALAGKASALQGAKADTALQPGNNISLLTNNVGFITENIPDGARIGGVAHFCRATKPTARIDGSALVVGDKWWDTSDRTGWFWNGTYWLSDEPRHFGTNGLTFLSGTPVQFGVIFSSVTTNGYLCTDVEFAFVETSGTPPTLNANNYYAISFLGQESGLYLLNTAIPPVKFSVKRNHVFLNTNTVMCRIEQVVGSPSFGTQYRYYINFVTRKVAQ